jgi:hypothetical protein
MWLASTELPQYWQVKLWEVLLMVTLLEELGVQGMLLCVKPQFAQT